MRLRTPIGAALAAAWTLACSGRGTDSGAPPDSAAVTDAVPDAAPPGDGGPGADAASDAGTVVLSPGAVLSVAPVGCAAAGTAPGATCFNALVTCAGLPDLGVELAVAEPADAAAGTVVMFFGGGGTTYFDEGFPSAYLADGLRVVQARFATPWEDSPAASIKAAACRVAAVVQWAFEVPHGMDRTTGFCTHGHSGGSGGLGYALAHYGQETLLDFVVYDAGPVFGRIDYGCVPELKGTGASTRFVCPDLPAGTFAYGGAGNLIDGWEGTTTCGAPYGNETPADIARWAADSVVSPGADYDYPQTEVSFWFCANLSNEAAGLGSFFADAVTSAASVNCVTGACAVEPPWSDPGGFTMMVDAMQAGCIPRHQ